MSRCAWRGLAGRYTSQQIRKEDCIIRTILKKCNSAYARIVQATTGVWAVRVVIRSSLCRAFKRFDARCFLIFCTYVRHRIKDCGSWANHRGCDATRADIIRTCTACRNGEKTVARTSNWTKSSWRQSSCRWCSCCRRCCRRRGNCSGRVGCCKSNTVRWVHASFNSRIVNRTFPNWSSFAARAFLKSWSSLVAIIIGICAIDTRKKSLSIRRTSEFCLDCVL